MRQKARLDAQSVELDGNQDWRERAAQSDRSHGFQSIADRRRSSRLMPYQLVRVRSAPKLSHRSGQPLNAPQLAPQLLWPVARKFASTVVGCAQMLQWEAYTALQFHPRGRVGGGQTWCL